MKNGCTRLGLDAVCGSEKCVIGRVSVHACVRVRVGMCVRVPQGQGIVPRVYGGCKICVRGCIARVCL